MKNIKFLAFFLVACFFASCTDDTDTITDTDKNQPDHLVLVDAAFKGIVTNASGEIINDATITLRDVVESTDENGYYEISGTGNQNGAYVKVTKSGYFDSYANVSPSASPKQLNFTLLERETSGTVNSSTGGDVIGDNYKISFEDNSFEDADTGASYNGVVTVYTAYIDPTNKDLNVIPGDLLGINIEDDSVILSSFGMVHVELEGASGQKLQINKDAELSVQVPSSKLSFADSTIPLWHFDTDLGLWKEEGQAQLIDDMYTGKVSHFTLWNCDIDFRFIDLSGTIIYNGEPVNNVWVEVEWVEENEVKTTHLDTNGQFSGKVPSGATIVVKVIDYCGNIVLEQNLGSIFSNTNEDFVLNSQPCDSSAAYEVYFGFNGSLIHRIIDVTVELSTNPAYTYHFMFTDTNQDIDITYDYYVSEIANGEFQFVTNTSNPTDNSDIYKVVGTFASSEIAETNEEVYISIPEIRYEIFTGPNSTWYNGDFSIRGKK